MLVATFTAVHPNLRGISTLKFIHPDALQDCDLLFLALPHGTAARSIERYAGLAPKLIDLSADFRLDSAAAYERWYGEPHPAPEWLGRFVYGLPEFNRERLQSARTMSAASAATPLRSTSPSARWPKRASFDAPSSKSKWDRQRAATRAMPARITRFAAAP